MYMLILDFQGKNLSKNAWFLLEYIQNCSGGLHSSR